MTDACPHCGTNLKGEPIPESERANYPPNVTHYTLMIQVVTSWGQGRCQCPKCHRRIS
jgi:hypothetical protein